MTAEAEGQLARVCSGVRGLDTILKGGFFEGGLYIIQGEPGSGKTILANQICFNHLAAGGRAVYATLLSESHARLMQQLRTLTFFDESALPDRLVYLSALAALEDRGLGGLLDLLRREIFARRATLLVIDGFLAAEASSSNEREFKKFVHELQSHAVAAGCTVFLLTNGSNRPSRPERTMVDGILMMSRREVDARSEREFEVLKLRASGYLEGRHSCEITSDGLIFYPRLESYYARPSRDASLGFSRVSSGVPSLDRLIGGGIPTGSTTVAFGSPGVGKTTFGLHWAGALEPDEKALFFGFFEAPGRLLHLSAFRCGGTSTRVASTSSGSRRRSTCSTRWESAFCPRSTAAAPSGSSSTASAVSLPQRRPRSGSRGISRPCRTSCGRVA